MIDFELSLGFEDVAIKQKKNKVTSRLHIDTSSEIIKGVKVNIPLIASNMSSVINSQFLIKLMNYGAFGFLHRALPKDEYLREVERVALSSQWVPVSIGVGEDQYELAGDLIKAGANIILIDIAHGYSDTVIGLGRFLKKKYPLVKVVVGNTVNLGLLEETADYADAVKVGIAQGFACETKNTAGCTEKQFSAILKFKNRSKQLGIPVISDGGLREPADLVKAIGAGANSAMAGKIFAMCPESAAEIISENGDYPKKVYYGMASRKAQNEWKGGLKVGTCSEGKTVYLNLGEPAEGLLERYSGALRSGITYAGGTDINSFQKEVEFVRFR